MAIRSSLGKLIISLIVLLLVAIGLAVLLKSCNDSSNSIRVSESWARITGDSGAVYATIKNSGNKTDSLISVSVPAEFAESAELHETTMASDNSGMMAMHHVDRLNVLSGATVKLQPGGNHIMLMGVKTSTAVGTKIPVTYKFEKMGIVTQDAEVR